ncbi:unnamed protein product [Anisakis simplex]|uniref:Serine/threonine-protein kinase kin-29 n=1 Tax=Anisakis simplex TaxID=6269 RepID=A0A0M3JVR4_ANISI|nr:unnamed protein product [Anisakis simplex]
MTTKQNVYTCLHQRSRFIDVFQRVGEYNIGKAIGKGNFAVVRLAKHSLSNTQIAVKIVNKSRLDDDSMQKIDREIRILKTLVHPHIIKLYEVIRTEQHIYIVTEYASHGEVFEMLMDKGRVCESEARRLFQQTSCAVAYCHSHRIVHRDLKAENLLLDLHNNVKLIDFGFSNFQQPQSLLSTWCGSPPYAAPELLLGKEYDGMKADVWSLGVILYILVAGGFPFPGHSLDKLKCAVLAGQLKIPYWVSVECADLIRKMLTFHPGKRYSVENVVQHRWFVAEQSPKMQQLIHESVSSGLHPDTLSSPRLNPTVLLFMQQHTKCTEEQIVEEVKKKNYECSIFATYELLCDKVRELSLDEANSELCTTSSTQPRRGSRGSIVSGKANIEIQHSTPTISAHHLAKLSLSTNTDDTVGFIDYTAFSSIMVLICELKESERSDDASSDIDDTAASSSSAACSWVKRHAVQLGTVVGIDQAQACSSAAASVFPTNNRSETRRHTLCAADPTIPFQTLLLTQQMAADSRLANEAAAHAAVATAALVAHSAVNPFVNTTLPTNLIPFNHLALYNTSNPTLPLQSLERRASAGEAMFGVNGYEQLLSTSQQTATRQILNGFDNLQAIGRCTSSSQTPSSRLTSVLTVEEEGERYLNQLGTTKRNTVHCISGTDGPCSTSRFMRSPYSKQSNGSERRSSWTSSTQHASLVTPQQQAQLERLYKQTVAGGSDQLNAIQQLQREFQQLRASTQISPVTTRAASSLLDSSCSLQCAPRISITDENNCCLTQPSSSATFDPVSVFEKQRPATAIGFSSMPDSSCSPERRFETSAKSIVSSLESSQVLTRLRSALDTLNITYEECGTCSLASETRRICVDSADGGRVEIDVSAMPLSINQIKSKVDFICSGVDLLGCSHLCSQLISKLNLPT